MDDRQELVICYSHCSRRCRKCGWVSSGLVPVRESWVALGGMSLPCSARSMAGAEQRCAHPSPCMDTHMRHSRTWELHPPSLEVPVPSPHPWRTEPTGKQRCFPSLGQLKRIRGISPILLASLHCSPSLQVFQLCFGNVGTLLRK